MFDENELRKLRAKADDELDDRLTRIEEFFKQLKDVELRNRIITGIQDVRKLDSGLKKFQFVSFLDKYIKGLEL